MNFRVKLWDCLVWILVFFPLVTGGIWIDRPGLFIELSELAIPVLITAVLGAVFHRFFRDDLTEASSFKVSLRLWRHWHAGLAEKPVKTLIFFAIFAGAILAWASLRRHWAMGSGVADLGIFTNAIWNLTHGNGYISSVKDGINLFGDHQSPIFWLLVPFFEIYPHAETLLIAQGLGLAAGAIPLFWLGAQYLGKENGLTAALPLLYWSYLPIRTANAFDFHPEVFMLPLFLAAIAGLQSTIKSHRAWGALAMVLALAGKESAGLVACGIGLGWIFGAAPEATRRFTRSVGLALIPAGFGIFWFDTRIVPTLVGLRYPYDQNFQHLGSNLTEIALSPVLRPTQFWSHVLGPARIRFFLWMLAPLAFLPLVNWRALLAAVPGFAILFLSDGNHRVSPIYHYGIEPAVGLLWALPGGLAWLSHKKLQRKSKHVVAVWLIFWCLFSFGRSEMQRIRANSPTAHHVWLRDKLLPCLAPLSTSASGSLVPHLANRPWAHHLPRIRMPDKNGEKQYVDCVIYDPPINNWPLSVEEYNLMIQELKSIGYREVFQCGTTILQRNESRQCLQCIPECK